MIKLKHALDPARSHHDTTGHSYEDLPANDENAFLKKRRDVNFVGQNC